MGPSCYFHAQHPSNKYFDVSKLPSLSGHSSIKPFRTILSKLSTLKIGIISLSRFGSNMSWNSDAGWCKQVSEIPDLMPSAVSTESGSTQRQSTQSVRLELVSKCFGCVKVIIQICLAFKWFNATLLLGNRSQKLMSSCSLCKNGEWFCAFCICKFTHKCEF